MRFPKRSKYGILILNYMDPIIALLIVVVSAFSTLATISYFTYKLIRSTLIYIKAETVYQAETVDPVYSMKEDETEVIVDDDVGLEASMKAKQDAAYRANS